MLGYLQRALAVPSRVVEQRPKASIFFISALLALSLATHGLTLNPLQSSPQSPVVTVTTNQTVYQPGDMIFITVKVSQPVNADVIWVFLEQPNNVNNYFQMLPNTGGTVNVTLSMAAPTGQWFAVAEYGAGIATRTSFSVQALPVPEFPSGLIVMILALTALIFSVHGRKASVSSANHSTSA
jgi:PDZ domain-containing secreted protein